MERDSARANGPENLKKSHVIETEFQPGLKIELGHAFSAHFSILLKLFARNFTFGAEANISARAEIRHVNGTQF